RRFSPQKLHHRQRRRARWCPRSCPSSTPYLRVDFLRILLDQPVDASCLLAQVFQLAHQFYPGLFAVPVLERQFVIYRFGHELAERNPARRGRGFGPSKNAIRNFQRCLHVTMVPYLWVRVNRRNPFAEETLGIRGRAPRSAFRSRCSSRELLI